MASDNAKNRSQPADMPAVYRAAKCGDYSTLQELLSNGALINEIDPASGCTALHLAVMEQHQQCVRLLLQQDSIEVDKRVAKSHFSKGDMALHLALKIKDLRTRRSHSTVFNIVELLTEHGASVTEKDECYYSPLTLACMHMPSKVVKLLLTHKEIRHDFDMKQASFYSSAINYDNFSSFLGLLDYETSTYVIDEEFNDDEEYSHFFWRQNAILIPNELLRAAVMAVRFAKTNKIRMLQALFKSSGDEITRRNGSDWLLANAADNHQCVRYLIQKKGCKPYYDSREENAVIFYSLCEAITRGGWPTFEMMLNQIPKDVINKFNNSSRELTFGNPVRRAIARSDKLYKRQLRALLERGFDPNRAQQMFRWDIMDRFGFLDDDDRYDDDVLLDHCGHEKISIVQDNFPHFLEGFTLGSLGLALFHGHFSQFDMLVLHGARIALEEVTYERERPEMSPLLLLIWSYPVNDEGSTELFTKAFDRLLAMGADLHYRSAGTPFSCPDASIAAACLHNVVVLRRMVGASPEAHRLNPIELFRDLTEKLNINTKRFRNRECSLIPVFVRDNIGKTLQSLLELCAPTPHFVGFCRAVVCAAKTHRAKVGLKCGEKLRPSTGASESTSGTGNNEIHLGSDENTAAFPQNSAEKEKEAELNGGIRSAVFSHVDTLQEASRMAILRRLVAKLESDKVLNGDQHSVVRGDVEVERHDVADSHVGETSHTSDESQLKHETHTEEGRKTGHMKCEKLIDNLEGLAEGPGAETEEKCSMETDSDEGSEANDEVVSDGETDEPKDISLESRIEQLKLPNSFQKFLLFNREITDLGLFLPAPAELGCTRMLDVIMKSCKGELSSEEDGGSDEPSGSEDGESACVLS